MNKRRYDQISVESYQSAITLFKECTELEITNNSRYILPDRNSDRHEAGVRSGPGGGPEGVRTGPEGGPAGSADWEIATK